MKAFFEKINLKWWEIAYILLIFAIILSVAIVFKSNAMIICNSLLIILVVFMLSKGWIIAPFVGVVSSGLYAVISYVNHFYGELIVSVFINTPIYLLSIVAWIKNISSNKAFVKIVKKVSVKEWLVAAICVAAASVGVFFLLKHFNTQNLVVSTISTSIGLLAGYMQLRRSELCFALYIMANLVCIALWSYASVNDLANLTTVITYSLQTFLNAFGILNWIRLRKQQSDKDNFKLIMKNIKN